MKYAKPEVTMLKSALDAITTLELNKSIHTVEDRDSFNPTMTAGAYEADE